MPSRLIRTAVHNLIGGVSQQPNSIRVEGMCEEQINAYSSIVDGLGKRQPTEHIGMLDFTGAAYDRKTLLHWINRDSDERYVVAISPDDPDQIKAFDILTGQEIPVTGTGNGTIPQPVKDYLKSGVTDARRELRAITIADVTLIANTKVTCKIDQSVVHDGFNAGTSTTPIWLSRSSRRAFLFLSASNFLTKYAVRLNSYTGDHQTLPKNIWDPPRRDTTQPSRTKADWLERTIAWIKTFNGNYATVNANSPSTGRSKGYGGTLDNPPYNPDPNGSTAAQFLYEGKQTGTVQLQEMLINLFLDPREPLTGQPTSLYPGGIQAVYDAWTQLAQPFNQVFKLVLTPKYATGLPPTTGTVMKIELHEFPRSHVNYREKLKLEVVEQGDSDGNLFAFSDEVQRIDQLPLVCEHGHTVRVIGIEEVDIDEFWVEFVVTEPDATTGDVMGEGHWKEGMKPLTRPNLDKTTMPVKLSRVPDGSGGFRFELDYGDWVPQVAGDQETNEPPSFVGKQITDMFLWRNRLGILTGSRVVMSEADEYFNFFRTTVRQLLDSDPIDIDAGHSRVANLRYAIPLEETCILFTDRQQFVMRGEPILTPRTTSVREIAYFETLEDIRPIGIERGIFYAFPSAGGEYSGVNHLQRLLDSESFKPFRSSGQIPRYIKGDIIEMTATSIESVMAVRTDDDLHPERIYIHKWHDRGDQRLLSAWMSFDLGPEPDLQTPPVTLMTEVLGMHFLDDDLYLFMKRQGDTAATFNIEKITFSGQRQVDVYPGPTDPPSNVVTKGTYRCLLDRRITDRECTFGYDSTTDELLITLPYEVQREDYSSSPLVEVVLIGRKPGDEGTQYPIESISKFGQVSQLRVKDPGQDLFGKAQAGTFYFFVGQTYRMFYEFTRPALRDRNQEGIVGDIKTGRYQLLRGHLACEDSAGGQVEVSPALHTDGTPVTDRDSRVYPFPQFELGIGASHLDDANVHDDVIHFGIYSVPDRIRLILRNETPFPLNPKSLEIEARYSRRSAIRRA